MNKAYGFWISPNGEVQTIIDDFGHKKFIEQIMECKYDSNEDALLAALDNGWIRIVNGGQSFMVDYRCVQSKKQLYVLKDLDTALQNNGEFHENYLLSYGRDYYFFDTIDKLINRMKERST